MLESGTCNDMLARFLLVACSCAVIVLCTASVACCWWWLAPGLPSPPGSAPSLSFTSWTCSWLLLVLLLLRWDAGSSPPELDLELQVNPMILAGWLLLCLCAVKEQWCSLCGSLLFQMWAASPGSTPGVAHLAGSLGLWTTVVLPAPPSWFCD
jgi:hypothetical protein